MQTTQDGTIFIRLAEYLIQPKGVRLSNINGLVLSALNKQFPNIDFLGFDMLKNRLDTLKRQPLPPLTMLASPAFLPGQPVIFSFQRRNRDYAGLVVIRTPDGSFLRNDDGSLFTSAQLARSLSGYPFYLTNGNTPQGLFRWTGFDTSEKKYIGPTTNLQLVMPNEVSYNGFFTDTIPQNRVISYEDYQSLLPGNWKNYEGIFESLYAGTMGRNEIIMHGTTINPDYYKGKPYWPQTPSMGCLCSYEEWDAQGLRTRSNQALIADALLKNGFAKGYVVVINLDDEHRPVTDVEVIIALDIR